MFQWFVMKTRDCFYHYYYCHIGDQQIFKNLQEEKEFSKIAISSFLYPSPRQKQRFFSFPLHSRSPCESKYSPVRQNFALSYFSFRLKYFYSRKIFLSFLLLFSCLTHIASSEFLLKKKSGTMFPTNWKYVKVLKSGLTFLYQATEVTKPRVRKRPLSLMMA